MATNLQIETLALVKKTTLPGRGLRLVVPALSSVVALNHKTERHIVDRTTFALVPAGMKIELNALSSATRLWNLEVAPALLARVVATHAALGVDQKRFDGYVSTLQILPRTVWIYEIVCRYAFECQALGNSDNEATRFLETELLKEVYFLCRDREAGEERAVRMQAYSAIVERALQVMEEALYEPKLMERLAKEVGASASTLLRAFKKDLGTTPAAYWRARRLDEALSLLRSTRLSVVEVATRVGYDNPAAFAQAFQARFSMPPSAFSAKRRLREAPQ